MERIEPSLNRLAAAPRGRAGRGKPPSRRSAATAVAIVVVLIGLAWLVWRLMYPHSAPVPAASTATPPAAAPAAAAPAPGTPLHPIESVPVATPQTVPLPALADSDAAMKDAIAGVLGNSSGENVLQLRAIVGRFVATIDNLPRKTASVSKLPVRPAAGTLATEPSAGGLALSPSNSARYAPYMQVLEAANVPRLVSTYVHFYPLFQQAYVDLGYPGGYFNDRLIVAIDDLLAAPEPASPVALLQPKVVYTFADPQFEAMSAGQKIMVRIGLANELRVKEKLREIRKALAGSPPPR
ncbi:MAG: DUF3014 domain-containing protein [Proteobacteria bacterium]|nr:DUF3014 domain-containing protein [Pseudomonadota bacterium]